MKNLNVNKVLKDKQIEASRLIDAMGGTGKVAELFSISTGAVSQWREAGICDARIFSIKLLHPELFKTAA